MLAARRGAFCSTWIRASVRRMASRRTASGMGAMTAPVIIRCSCSTSSAIWKLRASSRQFHSADGWQGVLQPVLARYRGKVSRISFRADAGFGNPDVYAYLEAEGAPSNGRASHAVPSPPTPFAFSLMHSPTISATSCARWRRPNRSRIGR